MRYFQLCLAILSLALPILADIKCTAELSDERIDGLNDMQLTLFDFMKFLDDQLSVPPREHKQQGEQHREQHDSPFDWTTDACTASADRPIGLDFKSACVKHDFGHRNGKILKENGFDDCWESVIKPKYDRQFMEDLMAVCWQVESNFKRTFCFATADAYHLAGREFTKRDEKRLQALIDVSEVLDEPDHGQKNEAETKIPITFSS